MDGSWRGRDSKQHTFAGFPLTRSPSWIGWLPAGSRRSSSGHPDQHKRVTLTYSTHSEAGSLEKISHAATADRLA